jgi:hypothetical protein
LTASFAIRSLSIRQNLVVHLQIYPAAMFDSKTKEPTEQESRFFKKEAEGTGPAVSVVQKFWMCESDQLSVILNDRFLHN